MHEKHIAFDHFFNNSINNVILQSIWIEEKKMEMNFLCLVDMREKKVLIPSRERFSIETHIFFSVQIA